MVVLSSLERLELAYLGRAARIVHCICMTDYCHQWRGTSGAKYSIIGSDQAGRCVSLAMKYHADDILISTCPFLGEPLLLRLISAMLPNTRNYIPNRRAAAYTRAPPIRSTRVDTQRNGLRTTTSLPMAVASESPSLTTCILP